MRTPRRITVVAHELRGFRPVGGMGTATTFLSLALARMGHAVEILVGLNSPDAMEPYWKSTYERAGVRVRAAPVSDEAVEPWHFINARNIELGLREHPPDVVIAPDFGAPVYTALRIREAGLAFDGTLFVLFCHGTRRYVMDVSPKIAPKDLRNLLGMTVHEQASVELADVVVSPSAYLVDWMRDRGWQLPERTYVIPYLTRLGATGDDHSTRVWRDGEHLERLTFFGRVDEKKGVEPFAAALNALDPELLNGLDLEFLGKTTSTWPQERVRALLSTATTRALRRVAFETELDQHEALARLQRPGTLAIMPSLQDNSPNAVYECLEHGIPFIATAVGGVPELVEADDRARVLIEPTATAIEAALRRVLPSRAVPRPARASFSGSTSAARWGDVLDLRPEFHAPARELGADDFELLLDQKDEPDPELREALGRAQARTGADVVTCGVRLLRDGEETLHFFSGEAGGLAALTNTYGTVALVRRALLEDARAPWPAEGDALWPLLARLVTSGARLISIPVPLVRSRSEPGSIERNPSDALLVAQHLEEALPGPLRSTARLVAGLASPA